MASPPVLFLMVGLPGVGKTTRARWLAREHPALRLTPDDWMIPLFGKNEERTRDVLEGRFVSLAHAGLAIGTSFILDFGLWSRNERTALRAMARSVGAVTSIEYLPMDENLRRRRIADRLAQEPGQTFHMTELEIDEHAALFQPPDEQELALGRLDDPPAGHPSWAAWASERWPSADLG